MFTRNTTQTSNLGDLSKDVKLASPPEDSTSALSWSPTANHLAVASWDNKVRIYDLSKSDTGSGITFINLSGPALAVDWSRYAPPPLILSI
jgi:mRNA export factor